MMDVLHISTSFDGVGIKGSFYILHSMGIGGKTWLLFYQCQFASLSVWNTTRGLYVSY